MRIAVRTSPGPGVQPSIGPPRPVTGAESVLALGRVTRHLPAETAHGSGVTQIYEGTNQIQRIVMARQLLK